MGLIDDNLKTVTERINRACEKVGRSGDEITLVGITKTKGIEVIRQALKAGLTHIGENRIQEAVRKIPEISKGPVWHMVGHLQTNKAKKAVELFDIIESVDSLKLAETLSRECGKKNKPLEVLLEVNSSGEKTKYGLPPEKALPMAAEIDKIEYLKLSGLMTIGPFTDDIKQIDRSFALTQELFLKLRDRLGEKIKTLSMGMSADFERAISFGSTEVRIGTALFGERRSPGN
jgi:pyridoxal phosphate enzyme (YggS family)